MNRHYNHTYYTPGFDNLNDFIPSARGSGKGLLATLRSYFAAEKELKTHTKN